MPVVVASNPNSIVVAAGSQGPQGIQGISGSGSALSYTFSWGDATPALITVCPAGKTVFKVEVVILTPFDVAPTVFSIGDTGNTTRLLTSTDIDSLSTGTYQTNPGHLYAAQTNTNVYLTPNVGTTTGNGLILIYIQG